MRKLIIDTDGGADDAIALLFALRDPTVELLAITTVGGNVPVAQATRNVLAVIEAAGGQTPPVYQGAGKPLFRSLQCATHVHGADGLGDCGLSVSKGQPSPGHAVEAILSLVEHNPGEVELVAIGPVTNVALAMLKEPDTMKKVRRIWSMATPGFGPGNATPVSEFNVYVDAESYQIVTNFGVPLTIIGYDVCGGKMAFTPGELARMEESASPVARFAVACNGTVRRFHREIGDGDFVSSPDGVAMAACLWPDTVTRAVECFAHTCAGEESTYGQVILCPVDAAGYRSFPFWDKPANCTVCAEFDPVRFKAHVEECFGLG